MTNNYLAVIKLRSGINASDKAKGILYRLRLRKKNTMVIFKNTPDILGQLKQVKDFVTYGEIDDAMLGKIISKRGQEFKGRLTDSKEKVKYAKHITINKKHYKPYFALHPPVGGFERKGIKKGFAQGGALGSRGPKIKELIERML